MPIRLKWNRYERLIEILYPWPIFVGMRLVGIEIRGLEFGWSSEIHPEAQDFKDL